MKCLKRIVSVLVAMIMVLGMSLTVFANSAETDPTKPAAKGTGEFTITLEDSQDGHEFSAYQIFKGDLDSKNESLSNIEWGEGVKAEGIVKALKDAHYTQKTNDESTEVYPFSELPDNATAAQVAKMLAEKSENNTEVPILFADVIGDGFLKENGASGTTTKGVPQNGGKYNYSLGPLVAGYYLVVDSAETVEGDNPDVDSVVFSRYILQVLANATVKVKADVPEIDKKIVDGADRVNANTAGIGDNVTYELKSNVPNHVGYNYYYFIINDTLDNGLDFNGDVVITVGGNVLSEGDYSVYVLDENEDEVKLSDVEETDYKEYKKFRIAFNDIQAFEVNSPIVVTYSAKVNENAKIGPTGNTNEVTLTYSNDPKYDYNGERDESKPGIPKNEKDIPTGHTPKKVVITYVTEIEIYKINGDSATEEFLAGATFTLTGYSTETVLTGKEVYTPDPSGSYWQLKDGSYVEAEPSTKATMKALGAGATAGYVVDEDSTEEGTVVIDGIKYRPYKETDAGNTVYILVEPNDSEYASTVTKFKKETATTDTKTTKYINMSITSDEENKGHLLFKGLGKGTYTITETVTPDGFNTAAPITVVVTSNINTISVNDALKGTEQITWQKGSESTSLVEEQGNGFYAKVANYAGALLPSTGGIGTTIFYVTGSILVLAAVVLLVAKKRMSAEK